MLQFNILPAARYKHPYQWVDEAIPVIKESGIKYEIVPFATVAEATCEEVMNVVQKVK